MAAHSTTPDTNAGGPQPDAPADPARELAEELIAELDLIGTIRSWNADQFALLASVEHVRYSVIYDEGRLETFDRMADRAEALGLGAEFRTWLALLLDPILISSTLAGVTARCRDWAVDVLEAGPADAQAPAPFSSDQAMIDWLLRNVDPPAFAGPTGEQIIEDEAEALLLTQALRAERPLAVREGWLRR